MSDTEDPELEMELEEEFTFDPESLDEVSDTDDSIEIETPIDMPFDGNFAEHIDSTILHTIGSERQQILNTYRNAN